MFNVMTFHLFEVTVQSLYEITTGVRVICTTEDCLVSYSKQIPKIHNSACLCWGLTAQSTQWGHVERGQFT